MIKKTIQSNEILSLCLLGVLPEADCKFHNIMFGKQTMISAERTNLLAPENYGIKRGKSFIPAYMFKNVPCSNDAIS